MSYLDVYEACAKWRVEHGYTQLDVALDTGYTQPNISLFETGQNNNLSIFLWYVERGFDVWQNQNIQSTSY